MYERREELAEEGRVEAGRKEARTYPVTRWLVVGLLAALVGLAAVAVSFAAAGDPSPELGPEDTMFDMAWIQLTTPEQINICAMRDRLTDEQYTAIMQELGTGNISPEAWMAGVDRHC